MSAKLNSYLADIDRQAEDMLFLLMEEMAENASVTEQFKAGNQLEWVQRMNNIRQSASEVVSNDVNKFLISQKEQPQILRLLHKIIAK